MGMEGHIIITLVVSFFIMELIAVQEIDSIVKNKIILSGIYSLIGWVVYFFGIYELIVNIYYAIPAIVGAVIGTMGGVYLKKSNK